MDLEHGSGKHSESHPEVIDGTGGGDNEDTYPRLRVRIGSSGHLQIDPEKIEGSESGKYSESHSEVISGSDSDKHIEPKPEFTVIEGDLYMPTIKFGSSYSSSSSSSSSPSSSGSSLYDLFDVIPKESADPGAGSSDFESSNKPLEVTQPASKDHENGVSIDNSHRSEENEDGSSDHALTPPVSGAICESLVHNMSPKQSPPLQVMERAGGYDPLRIPSSIFEKNKGTQPMDWSVASNESLFSIHVNRSCAVHSLQEKWWPLITSLQFLIWKPTKQKGGSSGMADNTIKDPAEYQNEEDNTNQAVSWKSPSSSNRSYGSGDSVKSFSFPILANGMRSGSLKAGVEQQQKQQHLESHPAPDLSSAAVIKFHPAGPAGHLKHSFLAPTKKPIGSSLHQRDMESRLIAPFSATSLFGELKGTVANVSKNKLSCPVPLNIGAMRISLRFLDASDNGISGSIPLSWETSFVFFQ
ncbi:SUPPRESSOR SRP40-LIKE PROTEIN [Salix viminalis]|uniref:SUPPRESSOR SRP40-LIKE PROTEIN n=1 Tax=Salix viminalis TaxID=40686 RepID=A0A9Q0Z491_SALVM|nr:SUPPRESSOR SRP40-LIKE PROTEIN [Salix viminalis]